VTEELKQRRQLAYLTHIWDDVDLPFTVNRNNIAAQVLAFFMTESKLVYPAKSYFVAIVYARFLEKHFGCDFLETLDDPELLPDDRFFTRYSADRSTYDAILAGLESLEILTMPSTQKTVKYACMEFVVTDGTDRKDNW
jgi:hypothetical protein